MSRCLSCTYSICDSVLSVKSIGSGLGQNVSNMIKRELFRLLGTNCKREHFDLQVKSFEMQGNDLWGPLLVLCLSRTRIGSNVKEAMKEITGNI